MAGIVDVPQLDTGAGSKRDGEQTVAVRGRLGRPELCLVSRVLLFGFGDGGRQPRVPWVGDVPQPEGVAQWFLGEQRPAVREEGGMLPLAGQRRGEGRS
jgi:hypothetical protein